MAKESSFDADLTAVGPEAPGASRQAPQGALAGRAFSFVTLGCAKNQVDTDRMRALLLSAGMREAPDQASSDVILINTCSFLQAATQESLGVLFDLADDMVEGGLPKQPIVMCGCVPSRYGQELVEELPEVSAFVNAKDEDGICQVVAGVLGLDGPVQGVSGLSLAQGSFLRTIEGTSAYVKISDGCDRFCSFCAIPYIRGRYFSRTPDQILSEVSQLMEGGVREVVLIGQDTGIWGRDLEGEGRSLSWLLRQVARVVRPYGGWVRVLYLQPEGMTDELIATIRDVPEVLPYIDIPIQHCNEDILRAMNRSGSEDQLRALFARLRQEMPGMVLRTTGMVGFPGETEDQFDQLYAFIQEEEFDYTSVFAYSPEEGTRGATLPDQVPEEVKREREQSLHDLAEELGASATASHLGETVDVIIDGVEEVDEGVELVGHAWFQAPDSDGAVHISSGDVAVGDVVRVKLVDSAMYELFGEIVEGQGDE